MERAILAFAVAPAWVPLGIGLYTDELLMTTISGILAYIGAVVAGLPIFIALRSSAYAGWLSAPIGCLVAMIFAVLTWFGFSLALGHDLAYSISSVRQLLASDPTLFFLPGMLGGLGGLTAWVIATPRRKLAG